MPSELLGAYPASAVRYDELLDAFGAPREHWGALIGELQRAAPEQLAHIARKAQRQVLENGVTYNVYADPQGSDRPWQLDLLPMILPSSQWHYIEAAVIQRATLMNRILLDVYGQQQLMSEGHVPASLIHGHDGFLRPCHGIEPVDGIALHHYAVDLARSPDGRWWVVRDRTQAPSGAGYALENRLVISRAFPDAFNALKVQRVAGFFASMRDALLYWSASCMLRGLREGESTDRPLVVLLTPGPYNETYYEHAYLARYLGFPLVQGQDLVVREGCVWLKTLGDLQRVHGIVRRVDDDFCDPLELRGESALGVPGLVNVARNGHVLITNALGSNVLESGALLGFLPRLSETVLGQPLLMPSIATWWCGEPAALQQVLQSLDRLVIKPTFPQLREPTVFVQDLDHAQREALVARLKRQPHHYIAQELVCLSQAPVWLKDSAVPGHGRVGASAIGLRVFACATPQGYKVMPGGLTRVAADVDSLVVSMQRGGSSKDTWVLTEGPVNQVSLLRGLTREKDLVRGETRLAARTVENLFWFGRYNERCNNSARLMRAIFELQLQAPVAERGPLWEVIVSLGETQGVISEAVGETDEAVQQALLAGFGSGAPGLASSVEHLFRLGFSLRERLSSDHWRSISHLHGALVRAQAPSHVGDAITLLDRVVVDLMTLSGFTLDGMTRDLGWRFLSLGRRIERLQFLCTVLLQALSLPSRSELDWLLELGDSIITYRSRYMARAQWLPVLDLLLLDLTNPRSVGFQLEGLVAYLRKIEVLHGACGAAQMEALFQRLMGLDRSRELSAASQPLQALLRDLYAASYQLSDRLNERFFKPSATAIHPARGSA